MASKLEMKKELIIKEDGRYLIYYTFDQCKEEGEKCQN